MSNPEEIEDDLPEQLRIRREKRAHLIERGIDPYQLQFLEANLSRRFARFMALLQPILPLEK